MRKAQDTGGQAIRTLLLGTSTLLKGNSQHVKMPGSLGCGLASANCSTSLGRSFAHPKPQFPHL